MIKIFQLTIHCCIFIKNNHEKSDYKFFKKIIEFFFPYQRILKFSFKYFSNNLLDWRTIKNTNSTFIKMFIVFKYKLPKF